MGLFSRPSTVNLVRLFPVLNLSCRKRCKTAASSIPTSLFLLEEHLLPEPALSAPQDAKGAQKTFVWASAATRLQSPAKNYSSSFDTVSECCP
jgi:hypothetical protein